MRGVEVEGDPAGTAVLANPSPCSRCPRHVANGEGEALFFQDGSEWRPGNADRVPGVNAIGVGAPLVGHGLPVATATLTCVSIADDHLSTRSAFGGVFRAWRKVCRASLTVGIISPICAFTRLKPLDVTDSTPLPNGQMGKILPNLLAQISIWPLGKGAMDELPTNLPSVGCSPGWKRPSTTQVDSNQRSC